MCSSLALPYDLYYSYILPDLLSDHLHRVLVYSETPTWHPFYVLPLVSRSFYAACHTLNINIFGLLEGEGGSAIIDILQFAQSLWEQANLPPKRAQPMEPHTLQQLMSSHSLIQVYMCAALAKSYLNLDVLYHLDMERRRNAGEFDDEDEGMDDRQNLLGFEPTGFRSRRFKMRDDNMHRVFLPLTCAMRLCDRVGPRRTAYIVADYLASLVPLYATAPLLLKYTQDLESYILRDSRLEMETWTTWTYQTLELIQESGRLLRQMQDTGKLVKSFKRNSLIPWSVLIDTNILQVLNNVSEADWGLHTQGIKERALLVRKNLLEDHMPAELMKDYP